jgi:uncharacterized protein YjbI with pentapeptide repeats
MSVVKLTDCQRQINASDANLESSRFEDVRLCASLFQNATLEHSRFNTIDMSDCTFDEVNFANAKLSGCTYEGMTVEGISLEVLLQHYREFVGSGT